jgi:hypothetical protein
MNRRVLFQALAISPLAWLDPGTPSVMAQSERCENFWEVSCENEGLPVTSDIEWAACPPETIVACPPTYATDLFVPPRSIDLRQGRLELRRG